MDDATRRLRMTAATARVQAAVTGLAERWGVPPPAAPESGEFPPDVRALVAGEALADFLAARVAATSRPRARATTGASAPERRT